MIADVQYSSPVVLVSFYTELETMEEVIANIKFAANILDRPQDKIQNPEKANIAFVTFSPHGVLISSHAHFMKNYFFLKNPQLKVQKNFNKNSLQLAGKWHLGENIFVFFEEGGFYLWLVNHPNVPPKKIEVEADQSCLINDKIISYVHGTGEVFLHDCLEPNFFQDCSFFLRVKRI